MSDNFDTPFADRASALDRFANLDRGEPSRAVIPAQAFSPVGERIIGAQAVAVHRNASIVMQRLRVLGAAAGEDWYYRFPVRNRRENRTDWIEGPSIKLANDLAREYGNCDVSPVAIQDLGDSWMIYARFVDYETGFSMTRPFQQRKGAARIGGDDDARRLEIALAIGTSKALRNVVVNALQTYSDYAFQEAKQALVDRIGKDLQGWITRTVARLIEHVEIDRVERVIGRKSTDWLASDVAKAIAMMKSVADGMATLDETFPSIAQEAAAMQFDRSAALDAFAAEGKPKRGRPTNAERAARKAARATQSEAQAAAQASEPAATQETAASEEKRASDDPAATAQPSSDTPVEALQELVKACERAETPEAIRAVAADFGARIAAFPEQNDRDDLAAVGNAYAKWRRGDMSEDELGEQVFAHSKRIQDRQHARVIP